MSLDILQSAIKNLQPIEFEYNKSGKTPGKRIGNPHAVFIIKRKDGSDSTKVHIVQTDGVSDSGQEFPSFRMFDIEELSDIKLLNNSMKFKPSEKYNSQWEGYAFVICKI
ncbi:MAG: hypothetical protein KA144_01670 [Xanthomonadaceae bacterium]|nr:hypothetical protein [Xanthomonadaceae bacterium]